MEIDVEDQKREQVLGSTQINQNENILPTLDEKIRYSKTQDYQNYTEQNFNYVNDETNILQETNLNSFSPVTETQNVNPEIQITENPTSFIHHEINQESSNFLENTELDQYIQPSTATPQFVDSTQQNQIEIIQENNGIELENYEQQPEFVGTETKYEQPDILPSEFVQPKTIYENVSNTITDKVNDIVENKITGQISNVIDKTENIYSNIIDNNIVTTAGIIGSNAIEKVSESKYVQGIKGIVQRPFSNVHVPTIIKIEDDENTPICPDFICQIYKKLFG